MRRRKPAHHSGNARASKGAVVFQSRALKFGSGRFGSRQFESLRRAEEVEVVETPVARVAVTLELLRPVIAMLAGFREQVAY